MKKACSPQVVPRQVSFKNGSPVFPELSWKQRLQFPRGGRVLVVLRGTWGWIVIRYGPL